jgi:hypothetical protein
VIDVVGAAVDAVVAVKHLGVAVAYSLRVATRYLLRPTARFMVSTRVRFVGQLPAHVIETVRTRFRGRSWRP